METWLQSSGIKGRGGSLSKAPLDLSLGWTPCYQDRAGGTAAPLGPQGIPVCCDVRCSQQMVLTSVYNPSDSPAPLLPCQPLVFPRGTPPSPREGTDSVQPPHPPLGTRGQQLPSASCSVLKLWPFPLTLASRGTELICGRKEAAH